MSITILKLCVLIIYSASAVLARYQLDTTFDARNLFTAFNFFTDNDPTHGYVDYQSYSSALANNLIDIVRDTDGSSVARLKVDSRSIPGNGARGRKSIRITSNAKYNHGLFIADILHMPSSACGAWPAFWAVGPNWVRDGEVDIIEGINQATTNTATLHVDGSEGTCLLRPSEQSGRLTSVQCDNAISGNVGCGVTAGGYGTPFNANRGGVYAMEWLSDSIKIWYFPRRRIPADITSGKPNPASWGAPILKAGGRSCNIDAHFRDMSLVFDTTFCGDLAGQPGLWQATSCYRANPVPGNTCQNYVQKNPRAFAEAFWSIKSVKVYQDRNPTIVKPPVATITVTRHSVARSAIPNSKVFTPTPIVAPMLKRTVIESKAANIAVEEPSNETSVPNRPRAFSESSTSSSRAPEKIVSKLTPFSQTTSTAATDINKSMPHSATTESFFSSSTLDLLTKATDSFDDRFNAPHKLDTSIHIAHSIADARLFAPNFLIAPPNYVTDFPSTHVYPSRDCKCHFCPHHVDVLASESLNPATVALIKPTITPANIDFIPQIGRFPQASSANNIELAESLMSVIIGLFLVSVLYFFVESSV